MLCAPAPRRLAVHGLPVTLDCSIVAIYRQISALLGRLGDDEDSPGRSPLRGFVRPYDADEVVRHLSPRARRLETAADGAQIYQEAERFWIVDEHWGISRINLLKGEWRSWVLPRPKLDAVHCAERAVVWPLAQLLRARGLHLLPAVSAVRDGLGVLILCPFSLEPELTALIRGGWKIIGQRWTAVREQDGMPALLHVPWRVECLTRPYRSASPERHVSWLDLTRECFSSPAPYAVCQTVLVVQPGRRPRAYLGELDRQQAATSLRQSWPMTTLHRGQQPASMARCLAQRCQCFDAQLSHDPRDLLVLLGSLPGVRRARPPKPVLELTLPDFARPVRRATTGVAA